VRNELINQQRQMEKERIDQLKNLEKEMKEMERESGAQQNPRLEEARKKIELMREEMKNVHESQNKEIQARLRDIEAKSEQQMHMQQNRQAELENLKSKLKEREHEMRRAQQEKLNHYKEELRKEQQQKNRVNQDKEREVKEMNRKIQELNREKQERLREEKKDRKDDDQSGLKPSITHWAVKAEDSLLKNVIRQYHRNLRYPGTAFKHRAEGEIYFSVVVDRNGSFKNFIAYTDKPRADNIHEIVLVGNNPVAVTEENLSNAQVEEIFTQEAERATFRAKPVVHPEERTYYIRVIFKFNKLNNDNTFQFRNTISFEKNEVAFVSHNSSASFSNSVDQDTIPAKKAVKRETKLAAKDGVKPGAKSDAKREAKPALKARPAKEPGDVDAKPHKARTSLFERKGIEPRKPVLAKRENKKLFGQKKATLLKKPSKKLFDKPRKPVKAKPVDGSGKIDEQEESEETITVTGEK
jgi:hypothetical protein